MELLKMKVKDRIDLSRDVILERYRAGESTVRIARDFDCNGGSIWLALQRWGEPIRQTKVIGPNRETILAEHADGLSAYAIDKKLGLPDGTAARAVAQAGCDISHRQKRREDPLVNHKEEIIRRYKQGEGCDLIANDFGCQRTSVMRMLRRAGVEMRKVRDYSY